MFAITITSNKASEQFYECIFNQVNSSKLSDKNSITQTKYNKTELKRKENNYFRKLMVSTEVPTLQLSCPAPHLSHSHTPETHNTQHRVPASPHPTPTTPTILLTLPACHLWTTSLHKGETETPLQLMPNHQGERTSHPRDNNNNNSLLFSNCISSHYNTCIVFNTHD